MKGSVLSRWSRYTRVLPAAMVLGSLVLLSSCAGSTGQTSSTPAPKDTTAPEKQTASAQPKPSKPTQPVAPPAPDTTPAQPPAPAAPTVVDSTAVAADFCKKITDGAQAAIKADSSLADPDAAVRKITSNIPAETVDIAFAKNKNTTCH